MTTFDSPSESRPASRAPQNTPDDAAIQRVLTRLQFILGVSAEQMTMNVISASFKDSDSVASLTATAQQSGIFVKEIVAANATDLIGFVREGYPVVLCESDGGFLILEKMAGRKIESSQVNTSVVHRHISPRHVRRRLRSDQGIRAVVAKLELDCHALSHAAANQGGHHQAAAGHGHHDHTPPLRRFLSLLNLDRRDVWAVVLFAFVAGILALAAPLAVESLVNIVSWGTYFQPLVVLAAMLLISLGLAGVFRILQTVVVELIQRRQFVRIVSDLAHRFPRANRAFLQNVYPRELANRVFDIMTIQKATAVLLLDGVTIVLSSFLGMLLLAFYHPFLLGFDVLLLVAMVSITWILGRGGIRTAIEESLTKYKVAYWLQDVLATPTAFKTGGGEALAIHRANQLTSEYLSARQRQFRIVIRQITFAIMLQVIASTVLLGMGGWLVMQGQLTLGQLVASELVVTVVVGAFAKAGKSLEKFYDLMAGIEKVGHLLDIPVDPRVELGDLNPGPAVVQWSQLSFHHSAGSSSIPAAHIEPGRRVALVGDDIEGRSLLAQALAGLIEPTQGMAEIIGFDAAQAAAMGQGQVVAYAGIRKDIFHASLRDNVDLGRRGIGANQVRESLQNALLWRSVQELPEGIQSVLQSSGGPLTDQQCYQLILARAMAGMPKLLVIDGVLDLFHPDMRTELWQALAAPEAPWTLIVATNCEQIAAMCDRQISIYKSST
jgi:putative ABC transport system ATP-binding protein